MKLPRIGALRGVGMTALTTPAHPCRPPHMRRSDFDKVQGTLMRAKQLLGEVLSAVEFADEPALGFSLGLLDQEHPLGDAAPFNMVIETSGR